MYFFYGLNGYDSTASWRHFDLSGSRVSVVLLQLVEKQIERKIVTVHNYSAYCTRYTAQRLTAHR